MQNPENKSISSQVSVFVTTEIYGERKDHWGPERKSFSDQESRLRKKILFLDLYIIESFL